MTARRAAAAVLLAATVALTSGCIVVDTGSPEPEQTAAAEPTEEDMFDVAAQGDLLVIEPLSGIDGAERFTGTGIGVDVPAGMNLGELHPEDGVVQYTVTEAGSDRAAVIITVTEQDNANEVAVDGSAKMTELQVSRNVADLTHHAVAWDGMPYAVALTGALDLVVADTLSRIVLVTTHSPAGDQLVAVSAEAEPNESLVDSAAFDVLRTVRFEAS